METKKELVTVYAADGHGCESVGDLFFLGLKFWIILRACDNVHKGDY
ncbi:MAG: hypothetical protein HQL31_07810 [Planctomycetes bacterium]|nr:hypothetical protein [Planctomycetota bacterium]